MDYLRQTVDSAKLAGVFDLPLSLKNKRVEVIVLPLENEKPPNHRDGSAFGCLKKYANPALITQEKGAWEQAMGKKHANR